MGGYGAYIWPSYGIAAVVMVGLLVASIRSMRARRAELAILEGEGRTRRRPRGGTPTPESADDAETP